jgi:hypothetical protein
MDLTECDCALRATELDFDIRRARTSHNDIRRVTTWEQGDLGFGSLHGSSSWNRFSQNQATRSDDTHPLWAAQKTNGETLNCLWQIERGERVEQNAHWNW